MKKLLLSVVVATACACFSLNAVAAMQGGKQFKLVGDTEFAGFCKAIVRNNVDLFKKNVAQQTGALTVTKSQTLDAVLDAMISSCADQDLVTFSQERNPPKVLSLIDSATVPEQIQQSKYKFIGDRSFANFCKAAVTNNVDLFKHSVRSQVGILAGTTDEVLSLILDSNNVTCSGQGLTEFSQSRQATDVANYIGNVKA